jgi:hypothetical protein
VLGLGNKTPIGHSTGGFGLKLQLLKQELELLPPETTILFTDAYDVIIQQSLDPLEEWCEKNPTKVLFAAETSKWPLDVEELYPSPLHFPYPYLNSGVFAGKANVILSLLRVPFTNTTDDQGYYTRQFLSGSTIVLDHDARYFQCMVGLKKEQVRISENVFDITHECAKPFATRPLILHLNNGTTRAKYFSLVIRTVLGPQYTYLARQISIRLITDFLSTNWKLIALYSILVFLLLWYLIKTYFTCT